MVIVITGADGFLGRHLRARLIALGTTAVRAVSRDVFVDGAALGAALAGADAVVHLAGVNRGEPATVEAGNVDLARTLVRALGTGGGAPRVVYANSVQSGDDTPYGRGKQRASQVLAAWASRAGAGFVDVVLPNLFGECGRPDYNSVVATFCHRLASGAAPEVHEDRRIELLHAQDAAQVIVDHLSPAEPCGTLTPGGVWMAVGDVAARLVTIAADYGTGRLPDLSDAFTLRLFNSYRSYLYPGHFPMALTAHCDHRGVFVETAQALGGESQSSFSTTKPGVTRGDHFHLRKVERFVVLRGRARIAMRPVWGGDVMAFDVCGERPELVDMPTLYAHNITNVGDDDLYTTFWANEVYDPSDTDTIAMAAELGAGAG
jgi:UDP-2-acetamido-2,6-beta-L-arabino-hexul-4-ose reductase